jgi:hypothetical protein
MPQIGTPDDRFRTTARLYPDVLLPGPHALTTDGELVGISAVPNALVDVSSTRILLPIGAPDQIGYRSAHTARTMATRLLGYIDGTQPTDGRPTVTTVKASQPSRYVAGAAEWMIDDGLMLRLPDDGPADLIAHREVVWLTFSIARRWCRALIAVAGELYRRHARAVGDHHDTDPADAARRHRDRWLRTPATPPLTHRLSDVLTALEQPTHDTAPTLTRPSALSGVDPLIAAWPADACALDEATATELIRQLAARCGLVIQVIPPPPAKLTSDIHGSPLTATAWRRIARTPEALARTSAAPTSLPFDLVRALGQAGLYCRRCNRALSDVREQGVCAPCAASTPTPPPAADNRTDPS